MAGGGACLGASQPSNREDRSEVCSPDRCTLLFTILSYMLTRVFTQQSHQQVWLGSICVFHTCWLCLFGIKIYCCLFSWQCQVCVFVLLCLQSDIEQIDMSAFSFNSHLLLSLLNMLIHSHEIWWHQAFQKIEMISYIEKIIMWHCIQLASDATTWLPRWGF